MKYPCNCLKFVWRQSEFAFFGAATSVAALFILYSFLGGKEMRKLMLFILVLSLCVGVFSACNANKEPEPTEGLAYYPLGNDEYGVMCGDAKYANDIVIASKYEGKPVTKILPDAFKDLTTLNSIYIPDSISIIAEGAFSGCVNLKKLSIPDSVQTIAPDAFYGCVGLTDVTTSANHIRYIHKQNLTNITITSGSINSTASYGTGFSGCEKLVSVTIKKDVTNIGFNAFSGCDRLLDLTIEDGVQNIGNGAFSRCSSLAEVTLPDSITSIGEAAFSGCSSLTKITLPNNITAINTSTFMNCSALTDINIPNGVTVIDASAFCNCTNLKSVVIPDSVTKIEYMAFKGCTALETIYYTGSETEWNNMHINGGNDHLVGITVIFNYVPKK